MTVLLLRHDRGAQHERRTAEDYSRRELRRPEKARSPMVDSCLRRTTSDGDDAERIDEVLVQWRLVTQCVS